MIFLTFSCSYVHLYGMVSIYTGMRAKLQFRSLSFMGEDIVPADTAKDLGVILDSNLTYDYPGARGFSFSPCLQCFQAAKQRDWPSFVAASLFLGAASEKLIF